MLLYIGYIAVNRVKNNYNNAQYLSFIPFIVKRIIKYNIYIYIYI